MEHRLDGGAGIERSLKLAPPLHDEPPFPFPRPSLPQPHDLLDAGVLQAGEQVTRSPRPVSAAVR